MTAISWYDATQLHGHYVVARYSEYRDVVFIKRKENTPGHPEDREVIWRPNKEGTNVSNEIKEPLLIKRESLIARLQEQLDAETAKRVAANQAQNEARRAVNDFVTEHTDEVVGYLWTLYGVGSWTALLEAVTKNFEERDYRPKAIQATRKENELEKFVRVLEMADNATIEITPDQSIYHLL